MKELAAPGLHPKVFRLIQSLPLGRVLDLGAGEGAFAKVLKDHGFEVTACDIDPGIFKLTDVPFVAGDFNAGVPLEDRSFDIVVFIEVLEHLKNPWQALSEIHRLLRPGGWLLLTTPNVGNLFQRFHYLFKGKFYGFGHPVIRSPLEHVHPFSLPELTMMMNETGFGMERFEFDRPVRFKKYLPTNKWTGLTTIVKAQKRKGL